MIKKILCGTLVVMLSMVSHSVYAQHYIGVRGGWGGGSARFTPARETGMEWGLYSGGLSYRFYTSQKFVGGIQADLQYMRRGFMYDLQNKSDSSYHRTLNSLELPFMWQPHFYVFQRHGRVFLNLGVYLSYLGSSKYYYQSKVNGIYEQGPYQPILTRDPKWGYGLCGGGGLGVLFGRCEVDFEARYYFGYSDILRNGTKYQGNPTHSPLDNINFSIAFYYRLGHEGIRAAMSTQAEQRQQQLNQKRRVRRKVNLPVDSLSRADSLAVRDSLQSIDSMAEGGFSDSTVVQPSRSKRTQKQPRRADAQTPVAQPMQPMDDNKKQ